jgi:hypothetical protein
MCINCFNDYEKVPITDAIRAAAKLVKELYETPDGGVGGYGHVVFDDWNLDSVEYCLKDAKKGSMSDSICEETRIASIAALEIFIPLTEDERAMALGITKGYIPPID